MQTGQRPAAALAEGPLNGDELKRLHAYWRAANYLSVGQIYLLNNPLLREALHVKHIKARELDAIYICGPGHGGPGMVANAYLEGTYSEIYPAVSRDLVGLQTLFRQSSLPG